MENSIFSSAASWISTNRKINGVVIVPPACVFIAFPASSGAEEHARPPGLRRSGDGRTLEVPDRHSAAAWGGEGIAELAKELSQQVKRLKKPVIKGGAVDGVIVGAEQIEDITKLPVREVLIGQVLTLLLSPAREAVGMVGSPSSTLIGQLEAFIEKQQGPAESGTDEGEAGRVRHGQSRPAESGTGEGASEPASA